MNPSDLAARQWTVAARPAGEILTAAAIEPGVELGLLGVPEGYSPAEIEGWLHDLIGVARETGREDRQPRPIPALLHHGLTGLLFSHAQLWNREGVPNPLSYAFVHVDGTVGFGWIGDAQIEVRLDGQQIECLDILVRDDEGREAHAVALEDAHGVEVALRWPADATPDAAVALEASWPQAATAQAHDASADPAPVANPDEQAVPPALAGLPLDDPVVFEFKPPVNVPNVSWIEREPEAFAESPSVPAGRDSYLDPVGEPLDLNAAASGDTASAPAPRQSGEGIPRIETRDVAQPPPPEPVSSTAPHSPPPAPVSSTAPQPAPIAASAPPPAAAPAASDPLEAAALSPESGALASAEALSVGTDAASAAQQAPTPVATLEDDADSREFADLPSESDTPPAGGSRLRRLFSRLAFWKREPGDPGHALPGAVDDIDAIAHDVAGVPEMIPPSPEAAEITERAVIDYEPADPMESDAHAPESARVEDPAGAEPAAALMAHAPESVPGPVPATPDSEHASKMPAVAPVPEPHPAAAGTSVPEPHATEATAHVSEPQPAPATTPATTPTLIEPHGVEPVTGSPAADVHTISVSAEASHHVPTRPPLRPQWPTAEELQAPPPLWKRPWVWAVLTVALFAGGWLVGHLNDGRRGAAGGGVSGALRAIGLGGARFDVMVNSRPPGAWISIDGKDIARRTPASVELAPGEHEVGLSFSDLGGTSVQVRGTDGERVAIDPSLWGSLNVYSSDEAVPVAVSVDGEARGFAPMRIDSLGPGAHEVRFSGPGLPSWGQTVEIRVNERADLIARPMTSPANGVIEVRATLATETGSVGVEGAQVWVDSEPAGNTPLTLDLPRGPHSVRVENAGETAPIQVIDLPGGNQRFASFQLRPGADFPTMTTLDAPAEIPLDRPTVVSVSLDGVSSTDVREMWLHVQTPDGPWRRYQMAWLKAPGSVVGVAVFPTTLFNEKGRVQYYMSAATQVGDEYFTEMQTTFKPGARPAPRSRGR